MKIEGQEYRPAFPERAVKRVKEGQDLVKVARDLAIVLDLFNREVVGWSFNHA